MTSKGTNRLIKQGAKLAESCDDILEELHLQISASLKEEDSLPHALDKDESLVYNLLSSEPQHIDELSEATRLGVTRISGILLNLEMRRLTRQLPGKNFVKL